VLSSFDFNNPHHVSKNRASKNSKIQLQSEQEREEVMIIYSITTIFLTLKVNNSSIHRISERVTTLPPNFWKFISLQSVILYIFILAPFYSIVLSSLSKVNN
tara:strand:- start:837 stop:1142 length:306 start_codon:yes stop_codon:yes gene_type:complete